MTGAGAALPFVGSAVADDGESFVEIIGTDPSDYPHVDLSVRVDTEAGRNGRLTEDAFRVYEDGDERPITAFEFSSSALDLVFVFDDSGSMGGEISGMQRQTKSLAADIDAAGIDARYALVSFKDVLNTRLRFTEDVDELQSVVDSLTASGGGPIPELAFDGINRSLEFDYRDRAQKVVICITDAPSHHPEDGYGNGEYTRTETAQHLQERGATFIAVSPGNADPPASTKVLAEETNGLWIDLFDADFDTILQTIIRTVIETYVLGYESAAPPGTTAPVHAGVHDPNRGEDSATSEVRVPKDAVASDAIVVDQTLPPTGVRTDESVMFGAELNVLTTDIESLSSFPEITITWRDRTLGAVTPELESRSFEGDTATFEFRISSAESIIDEFDIGNITPEGLGYNIDLTPEGSVSVATAEDVRSSASVYAFGEIDTVGVAPVVPNDFDVAGSTETGASLFHALRRHAEFVNEHYASGLGSMGAHGFDFEILTQSLELASTADDPDPLEAGWIRLDDDIAAYNDGGGIPDNSFDLPEDAARKVVDLYDVAFGRTGADYDTFFTVLPERYSKAFYRGSLAPDALDATTITIPLPVVGPAAVTSIDVPVSALTDLLPISPVKTPNGKTDAILCELNGSAWRHELGHSLGPNNQVGFPDFYHIDDGGNFGVIHDWGLMGSSGDTFSAYSRALGGDLFSPNEWLVPDHTTHFLETTISPVPLTEKRVGDPAEYVDSTYMDWWVDLDSFDDSPNPLVRIDPYYIEARKSFESTIEHPEDGNLVSSPTVEDGVAIGSDGVAIYRYGGMGLELAPDDSADDDIDHDGEPLETLFPTLNYHVNPAGTPADPTLTDDLDQLRTYYDPESAAKFELLEGFESGAPSVQITRDATEHLPEWTQSAIVISVDILEAGFAYGEAAWEAITRGVDDAVDKFWDAVDDGKDIVSDIIEEGESIVVDVTDAGERIVVRGIEDGEQIIVDGLDEAEDLIFDGLDTGNELVSDTFETGGRLIVDGADRGRDIAVDVYEDGSDIVIEGLDKGENIIQDTGGSARRTVPMHSPKR